jgi:SAM-dependent methyltransferase
VIGPDSRLRRALRNGRRALSSPADIWQRALPSELTYWARYIQTEGLDFPDDYRRRLDPNTPIGDPLLLEAIDRVGGTRVRIIDVGAGPMTCVGKHDPRVPERTIEIVAVDPLAREYAGLIRSAGISPPVATQQCAGEDVARVFGQQRFDIAFAQNSLDHSADPISAIESMVDAVRPGGAVVLHHYRREGETNRYEQLHQWNFDVQEGRLLLYNRRQSHDVGLLLADRATTSATIHDGSYHAQWVAATISRHLS